MKKTLFILAILFCFTIVKGQNVSDTIFDDYFLPDYIDVGVVVLISMKDLIHLSLLLLLQIIFILKEVIIALMNQVGGSSQKNKMLGCHIY